VQLIKDGEQKWFKQFGHFSLVLFLSFSALYAGSFEDFKKKQDTSFSKYVDERDAAFNSYLKTQWQEYSARTSPSLYEREKPKSITPALATKVKSIGPKVNIKLLPKKPTIIPEIPHKIEDNVLVNNKDIYFDFFGTREGFTIDNSIKESRFYPQNQSGILNFFNSLASSEYQTTLYELNAVTAELELNDWAIYQLVVKLSRAIYSNEDDIKLYSWFIFNKLGYEVKIGIAGKHVVLMHYSKKIIYSTPNYKFGEKSFYVISNYAKGSVGKVYTYEQSYPNADKALDLSLKNIPKLSEDLHEKTLTFKQLGKEYSTSYYYNKNLIDFMATYPQADYDTYFNAPMSETTYRDIAKNMKKYVDTKHASVGINFVLNFVQKAFIYEVDQKQFGREKVMFADETLFYNKSDCEDRAILFAYLVKELFGISVIGVQYKDHMATALYVPMRGDSVKANGRRFVIADPTYMNANIGVSMPRYKSIVPESFIVVRKES